PERHESARVRALGPARGTLEARADGGELLLSPRRPTLWKGSAVRSRGGSGRAKQPIPREGPPGLDREPARPPANPPAVPRAAGVPRRRARSVDPGDRGGPQGPRLHRGPVGPMQPLLIFTVDVEEDMPDWEITDPISVSNVGAL